MDNDVPFTPVNFFQLSIDCNKLPKTHPSSPFTLNEKNFKTYLLPDLSALTSESSFADVAMGWSDAGIELFIAVKQAYLRSLYPQFDKGDSLEVCIDTRDVKTSGYNTRFCHHFYFLPESVDGQQAGELTKFRTEDAHELCNGAELKVEANLSPKSYILRCFIPASCLHGYDPEQFDRIGFTYKINRPSNSPQEFSVVAEDFKFQEQPSLWASVRLVK